MSETHNNTQNQKPRISKLAVASLVFSVLWIVSIALLLTEEAIFTKWSILIGFLAPMAYIAFWATPLSLILGIGALVQIKLSKGGLRGIGFAVAGVMIGAIWTAISMFAAYQGRRAEFLRNRSACQQHLRQLYKALSTYTLYNEGKYPIPDNWCDLLEVPYLSGSPGGYPVCEAGDCRYAMNPNCMPNSPNDVVLLFETANSTRWFGGPEIATAEKHEGKGCNVLFNGGDVNFIAPDQIWELNWNAEQKK